MNSFLCIFLQLLSLVSGLLSPDTIANRLEYQKWLYPQERVSIDVADQEWAAGDTIWMKVRVVDASSLLPSNLSKFVYVELTDPFGRTCKRVKLKNIGDSLQGYMPLPEEMAEGVYTLTGYTRFMNSLGPDYFNTVPVYVYGSGRPAECPTFSFSKKGENLIVNVDIGANSDPGTMDFYTARGIEHSSRRKKSHHAFELNNDEWKNGVALARIGNFGVYVPLPPDSSDFNVVLSPEGGNLVPDILNNVGVSARDASGRGIGVKGSLVNSLGETIVDLETDKEGFGCFSFVPDRQENYHVDIMGRTYPISKANDYSATLQVNSLRKEVVTVIPVGDVPSKASLIIHCRGNLIYFGDAEVNVPYVFKKFDLPEGINEFCLIDKNCNTISRRMVFIDSEIDLGLKMEADIPRFRNQIGDYKVPFGSSAARIAMDKVMLGSGVWGRYDIPSVLLGDYDSPTAELEVGGEISGTVKSRWRGKPMADAEVSIISSDIDYCSSTKTDDEGHFVLNGVDWPEGTRFVMKVVNSKGDYEDNYTIDEESYPSVNQIIPPFEGNVYTVKDLDDQDIKTKLSRWLDEVKVTALAKDSEVDDISKIYEVIGGRTVDQDYFDQRAITTYEAAIRAFPALTIQNGKVMNNGKEVEFWVDGVKWVPPYESSASPHELGVEAARKRAELNTANIMTGGLLPSDLSMSQYTSTKSFISDLSSSFPFHIVDKIVYLRPSTALIVSNQAAYGGGALMIYTKNKNRSESKDYDLHMKIISPLGYQK